MADDTEENAAESIVMDDEWREAFSGPAPVANRIYATNGPSGIRIAFCEQFGTVVRPVFRSAVLLSFDDAIAFRNLLNSQLEPVLSAAPGAGGDLVDKDK